MDLIQNAIDNKHIVTIFVAICLFFISIGINKLYKNKKTNFTSWIFISLMILFLLDHYRDETWMNYVIFSFYIFKINIRFILIVSLTVIMATKIANFVKGFILKKLYSKYDVTPDLKHTLNSVANMIIFFIALIIILKAIGLSLSSLAVFGSVVGVGLAFGLQNITSNFISGIIILFDKHIKIGDRIKIKDQIVDIEKIDFRATVVKSIEDKRMIVPNSYFLENIVENLSHGSEVIRLTIPIGASYDSDPSEVKEILLEIANNFIINNDFVIKNPKPFVYFKGFSDSQLDFELFIWINDPKQTVKITSDINFMIFDKFNENGIEIPYPQRDINFRNNLTKI